MNLINSFKTLGLWFLDLLFPISCLVCGADGKFACDNCLIGLPKLQQQQCLVCQTPSPFGKTHLNCVSKNTVDGSIAALPYKNPQIHKIIETFKYNFISDLALPLSQMIVGEIAKQNLSDYFQDFTVVPVPLHPRRFNWRGFNQAELLSAQLAENLKLKVDSKLVTRQKFTKPQVKLDAAQRRQNMDNAFVINPDAAVGAGKKILLVDDVVTSGSTANELAKLFKRNHAAEVWLLTAAHG